MLDSCRGVSHIIVYVRSCAVNNIGLCMMASGYWKEDWTENPKTLFLDCQIFDFVNDFLGHSALPPSNYFSTYATQSCLTV